MTIEFNPERKRKLTLKDMLEPAMRIKTQRQADKYLKDYVAHLTKSRKKRPEIFKGMTPEDIAKFNLAYYAGYYNEETRQRVEKLFKCVHPVFGAVEQEGGDPYNLGQLLSWAKRKVENLKKNWYDKGRD